MLLGGLPVAYQQELGGGCHQQMQLHHFHRKPGCGITLF